MDHLEPRVKVILVGVGGATCSGKTTLAKHLGNCLPDSFIVHQDDFAPPQELIPIHPIYNVQDWDAAEGAIDWDRLSSALEHVKATGSLPREHKSHDHLNEQKDVPVEEEIMKTWVETFQKLRERWEEKEGKGIKLMWVLVDGFLLYWDKRVRNLLDVRFFLRVPYDTLKARRHERHGYHTAVQSDPEGSLWRDPPEYWEQIVHPAYKAAHAPIFENGDVENGKSNGVVEGLIVMNGLEVGMSELIGIACEAVEKTTEALIHSS